MDGSGKNVKMKTKNLTSHKKSNVLPAGKSRAMARNLELKTTRAKILRESPQELFTRKALRDSTGHWNLEFLALVGFHHEQNPKDERSETDEAV
jgi:hypothetical protein